MSALKIRFSLPLFLLIVHAWVPGSRIVARSAQEKPAQSDQSPPHQSPQPQQPEKPQEPPQFRVDVNLVTVRFSVKDGEGRFVNALRQSDFTLYEEGVKQAITFFEPPGKGGANIPVALTFLLDVSGSTYGTRAEEIAAAESFLRNVPLGTEVAVYGFSDKLARFQDFTANPAQLSRGFQQAHKDISGRSNLYASLSELSRNLGKRRDGKRRIVVIISDGEDPDVKSADPALKTALQNNVTIFTVWVPSVQSVPAEETPSPLKDELDRQHAAYSSLAERSGGRSFESFESIIDFEGTLAEINASLFGSLYTLGFITSDPYAERLARNIQVVTNRPDYQVQGVFANLPERLRTKKHFVSALFKNSRLSSLPLDLHTTFHEIGGELDLLPMKSSGALQGLPFRLLVSPYSLAGFSLKQVRTQLGIIGVLVDSHGKEISRVRDFIDVNLSRTDIQAGRMIVYNGKVLAPPGEYMLRVALVDLSNWRMTAFENKVSVGSSQ